MNNRKRKKWLKKHNRYVNPKECWDLDYTIAQFVLPRLKKFKEDNEGYPIDGDMNTFEKWQEALDKMILAFEYIVTKDDWWFNQPQYDYSDGLSMKCISTKDEIFKRVTIEEEEWVDKIRENHKREEKRRQKVIEEGLLLFAKYYQHLWW